MKISFVILCFCWQHANGHTIKVGRLQPYQTISAAIAIAGDRDTVIVEYGIYKEKNLVISKPLVLKGINHPLLDGEHTYEIISIKADSVTVDGFLLQHTGVSSMIDYAAIKIYNRRNATITNNIIKDAFFGIYSQNCINGLIQNNTLIANRKEEQQSGNGIHCWKSDSMRIIGNTVTGHRDGIYFEFVTHSVIWRNTSEKNLRYGLHFMFSNNDSYITNIFKNNGAGVAVMFSQHVKMFHNYFEENWGDGSYGLLLKEISDSYIEKNQFIKNTIGIFLEGASRVQMNGNIFQRNGWGMKIQANCADIIVTGNNFIGNTFDVSTNGTLAGEESRRKNINAHQLLEVQNDGNRNPSQC